MRPKHILTLLAVSTLLGETVAESKQVRAMRRQSDLRMMEQKRSSEEEARRIYSDMMRPRTEGGGRGDTQATPEKNVFQVYGSVTVSGKLTDENQNPISDVEVRADFEDGGTWTKTGSDGTYEMSVNAGRVWIRLNSNDLVPDYLRPIDKEVEVEDGATATVNFTAYGADATISGMVLLDGAVLAGVSVSADGRLGYTWTETGADGTFTLSVASEGDVSGGYNLWVNTHDFAESTFRTERHDGITSGTSDLTVNLVSATASIEGTVTDNSGVAVAEVTVFANQHQTGNHVTGVTGADGSFRLNVIGGQWWLDLYAGEVIPDYLVPHGRDVNVTDGASRTQEFILYSTDAEITGTVTFDSEPAVGVYIGASSELGWTEAVSDSTGTFVISVSSVADEEGGYHLWVHDWSVPRGAVIEENYYDIPAGSEGIDFRLVSPNSFIEGTVTDDQGEIMADLRVWAEREGRGGFTETRTDDTGHFRLGVAAGRWRMNVDGWELWGTHLAPDWIEVSVHDGGTATKDIILLTADAVITGTVYVDGAPLGGIGVEARSLWGWTQDNTGSDGKFSLAVSSTVDEKGGYRVYAHDWELDDDLFHLEEHWNVPSGSAGINVHYVYADAFVEGTAVDEDGSPIADVKVYANSDLPPWNWTETETDASGAFKLGMIEGDWWIRFDVRELIPQYLGPRDSLVTVSSGETVSLIMKATSTDATILGAVTLDGEPMGGMEVRADSPIGWTETRTDDSGHYILSVASEADDNRGYNVWMDTWRLPDSTYVDKNWYNDVLSGSADRDFHVFKTKSGFKGQIFSEKTDKPVQHGWIWAWDGAKQWGQHAGAERNGRYKMWLPNGTYDLYASGDGYEEQLLARGIVLNDEVVEYTVYLEGEGPQLFLEDPSTIPITFALHQNFPNPFNPFTTIHYVLPEEAHVVLTVYDLLGKEVKRVVHETQNAGIKTTVWDGTDLSGADVSTGLYIYKIRAGTFSQTRKMVLIR
ncbi:MAG: hypothetical protein CMG71_00295 [Candidatus Marinimicrobia bacterium]|nr:hypothetical protein [Candidatus Neomarinimicrobiota bacterium]